jgi:hypothetical protein
MVAEPMLMPLTCGCVAGVVAPAGIRMLGGTVTLEASLLVNVTVIPPAGAGLDRVTANAADWPRPTVVFAGMLMVPAGETETLAIVSATAGRALA